MSLDYINEAFKRLELLNEETFDTSMDGINNLSNFMDQDNTEDLVKVIDPEAEVEDDVQDSYVGKVITNCNVCHSHIFENKEDIVIDEDGIVNPEKQCPYCGETSGFVIVGEITEFVPNKSESPEPESDQTDEGLISTALGAAAGSAIANKIMSEDTDSTNEGLVNGAIIGGAVTAAGNALFGEDTGDEDDEPLTEDVNNVNVETDDSVVNVHTEESGKVVVTTEPKAENSAEGTDAVDAISPVSDDTMTEIEMNNGIDSVDAVKVEDSIEDDEDTVDVDFDEVDESDIDELGEAYLKNVYENVESFKTTSVSTSDSQMILEGVITFKSGNRKNTGFIFEAYSATADGKVRFVGKNEHFSRGSKSFVLSGRVENKKLLPESFSYNYRAKNSNGKSDRVSGTIRKK